MKKLWLTVAAIASTVLLSPRLMAQGWPYPTAVGSTAAPQSCPGCPEPARTSFPDDPVTVLNPTWQYSEPITAFTGRFVDSNFARDWQQPFRTARAWEAFVLPERNRVYLKIGSAIMAYNIDSFFNRLESRDNLVKGAQRPDAVNEYYLKPDKYFYAEDRSTGWDTVLVDGQERLGQIDFDDRGNVYLGYGIFGWGIVKDDGGTNGGLMKSLYQNPIRDLSASYISALKTSAGRYYVLAGGSPLRVWDVTDPTKPVKQADFSTYFVRRTHTAKLFAGVSQTDGRLHVYGVDSMVSGGAPIKIMQTTGQYTAVTTDGTNIYAAAVVSGGSMAITTISPNGSGGINESVQTFRRFSATAMSYNGGYLAIYGIDGVIGEDVLLYKVSNGTFEEIPLNSFVNKYYAFPPTNYVKGSRSILNHAAPVVVGSKLYLIISAFGLGDVLQIRAGDTITASIRGTTGGVNPSAPARAAGDIFYGDRVEFLALTSGSFARSVQWNFGNPEAAPGADPNTDMGGTTSVAAYHRYSGLTPSTLGGQRTVTADSSGLSSTVKLTLKPPAARFRVSGTTATQYLFAQPNASSPAPIILGDSFTDASDGGLDGHYTDWTLDGTLVQRSAGQALYAGDCGAHSLSFTAHYGPANGFVVVGPDYPVAISPFNYGVRPFVADVATPTAAAGVVTFTSTSRVSSSYGGSLAYLWELIDASGAVVKSSASYPTWSVPAGEIPNGSKARLTLTGTPGTGACAPYTTSSVEKIAPMRPDPKITATCQTGGSPCHFTVSSLSNADMSAWTYAWSVGATSSAFLAGPVNTSAFDVTFTTTGNFAVNVTATNGIGSGTSSTTVPVSVASNPCPTMNGANVSIGWSAPSGCSYSSNCTPGEVLTFSLAGFYQWGCSTNWTINWKFDGVTGPTTTDPYATVTSQFNATGNHTVSADISNGNQTYTSSVTVKVAGSTQPPPPPPPPPTTGCQTMNSVNVFITAQNSSYATCGGGANCTAGTPITISAANGIGYSLSCATHTLIWTIGGQQLPATTALSTTYTFPSAGNHAVQLTISNGTQSFTTNTAVTIGPGGTQPPPTGSCQPMTAANVFFTARNQSGMCTSSGNCSTAQPISFDASAGLGYTFECATHTFNWSINGQPMTGANVSYTFNSPGTYPVTLSISNGSQTYSITQNVVIAGSSPAQPDVTLDILTVSTGVPHEFSFTPIVTPATASIAKYLWEFGDGDSATRFDRSAVIHTYHDNATSHNVTLRVHDSQNRELKTHTETIGEKPARRRGIGRH